MVDCVGEELGVCDCVAEFWSGDVEPLLAGVCWAMLMAAPNRITAASDKVFFMVKPPKGRAVPRRT